MGQGAFQAKQFTALNAVYLLFAFLGMAVWVFAGVQPPATPAAGQPQPGLLQTRMIVLLLVCMLELALGIYIRLSRSKAGLFLQCLSLMLLLAGHILFVFAFYNTTTLSQQVELAAAWCCGISVFMHLGALIARLPFQVKIVMRRDD